MTDSKREAREIEEQAQYAIDHLRDTAQTLRSAAPNATWHYEALEKAADTLESYDSLLKENQELREEIERHRSTYFYRRAIGAENVSNENKRIYKMLEEKDAEIARLREENLKAKQDWFVMNEEVKVRNLEVKVLKEALARADGIEGV